MQPWIELGVLTAIAKDQKVAELKTKLWPAKATMDASEGSGGMPPTQPIPGA